MEITASRYDELVRAEAQKEVLKREIQIMARDGVRHITINMLKTIFDLWGCELEPVNLHSPCDYQE